MALVEAPTTVADQIEVAGHRPPTTPGPDLHPDLDLACAEPASLGSLHHEQHKGASYDAHAHAHAHAQGQGQGKRDKAKAPVPVPVPIPYPEDDGHNASAKHANDETGLDNGGKRVRRGSHRSSSELHEDQERQGCAGGSSRHAVPAASFPPHNDPRRWFLTQATSPLAVRLIRLLLAHGDFVVACLPHQEIDHPDRGAEFKTLISECKGSRKDREGWKNRIHGIRCDGRSMGLCTAAIAEAVHVFERIDILLCCKFEAVVGTVEELSTTPVTQNLVREQFETMYFSQVNFIQAALPTLRAQQRNEGSHIILLSTIGGHIGTPGMATHTAATWAMEGFCDSLAYEAAPFDIRVTIVQPNKEIQSLTNKIIFAPQLPWYDSDLNPDPSIRDIFSNLLNANPDTAMEPSETETVYRYPKLPAAAVDKLVQETVHALVAIGGIRNPPARHIVGFEGALAVQEKLKTVTEELEDYVEASVAVDIFESELKDQARTGNAPESSAALKPS